MALPLTSALSRGEGASNMHRPLSVLIMAKVAIGLGRQSAVFPARNMHRPRVWQFRGL